MAKTTSFVIDVDQTQFDKFIKDFTSLSERIKGLTDQFTKMAQSIDQTTKSLSNIQSTTNKVLDVVKGLGTRVSGITTHFGKWVGLVGGVAALLGSGGFLVGMDRISEKVIQQRRRMLLYGGGDTAGVQGAEIGGKSILEDPSGVMKNLAMARAGGEGRIQMMQLGLDPKKKPADLTPELIEKAVKLAEQNKNAGLGFMSIMRTMGLRGLVPDEFIASLRDEPGRKAALEAAAQMRKKPVGISDDAAVIWQNFNQAMKRLSTTIDNVLINKLSTVAGWLTSFAEKLEALVKWINDTLTIPTFKKTIQEIKKVPGKMQTGELPYPEAIPNVGGKLNSFADVLEQTTRRLSLLPWPLGSAAGGGAAGGAAPARGDIYNRLNRSFTGPNIRNPFQPQQTSPNTTSPSTTAPTTAPNGGATPVLPPAPMGMPDVGITPGPQGALSGGTNWASAARSMMPSDASRGFAATSMVQMAGGIPGASRGPLSASNWQNNRVATLRVENQPGSNVFLTAASMTG
jgi:hypothetical protein